MVGGRKGVGWVERTGGGGVGGEGGRGWGGWRGREGVGGEGGWVAGGELKLPQGHIQQCCVFSE